MLDFFEIRCKKVIAGNLEKKLARFLLSVNHYILWFVKNKPQHRDFL